MPLEDIISENNIIEFTRGDLGVIDDIYSSPNNEVELILESTEPIDSDYAYIS